MLLKKYTVYIDEQPLTPKGKQGLWYLYAIPILKEGGYNECDKPHENDFYRNIYKFIADYYHQNGMFPDDDGRYLDKEYYEMKDNFEGENNVRELKFVIDVEPIILKEHGNNSYVRKNVTIPSYLADWAKKQNINLSRLLANAIEKKLDPLSNSKEKQKDSEFQDKNKE